MYLSVILSVLLSVCLTVYLSLWLSELMNFVFLWDLPLSVNVLHFLSQFIIIYDCLLVSLSVNCHKSHAPNNQRPTDWQIDKTSYWVVSMWLNIWQFTRISLLDHQKSGYNWNYGVLIHFFNFRTRNFFCTIQVHKISLLPAMRQSCFFSSMFDKKILKSQWP